MMRVLIIGANSYVGSGVARALKADGINVTGLARTPESTELLKAAGLNTIAGDLTDLRQLGEIAKTFDAVIAVYIPYDDEDRVMRALLAALEGSNRPLIFTSGTGVLGIETKEGVWSEESFGEDDSFTPAPWLAGRVAVENMVRASAARGMRPMVIRPPLVWGNGGSKQVPTIFDSVKETGVACYIGRGLNAYSNVHVDDLAQVYRLALAKGTAGALYHAVAGEVNFRSLAEAVAKTMNCGTRSVDYDQACRIWGPVMTQFGLAVNSRSKAVHTRRELGWIPRHLDLVDDIRTGSYRAAYENKTEGEP